MPDRSRGQEIKRRHHDNRAPIQPPTLMRGLFGRQSSARARG
jgi:hypothetical protein